MPSGAVDSVAVLFNVLLILDVREEVEEERGEEDGEVNLDLDTVFDFTLLLSMCWCVFIFYSIANSTIFDFI